MSPSCYQETSSQFPVSSTRYLSPPSSETPPSPSNAGWLRWLQTVDPVLRAQLSFRAQFLKACLIDRDHRECEMMYVACSLHTGVGQLGGSLSVTMLEAQLQARTPWPSRIASVRPSSLLPRSYPAPLPCRKLSFRPGPQAQCSTL